MDIYYRKYKPSDEDQVNKLAISAFEQYADLYENWEGFREKISQMAKLAEFWTLMVAEHNNKIIGAVVYMAPNRAKATFFKAEWAVIRMLVVAPESRSQGIGRQLTDICFKLAKQDNAQVLALHTSEIMIVALSMYLKMGFQFFSDAPYIHGVKYAIYTKAID